MSNGEPLRTENDSFDNSSDLPLMILIKKTMKRMKFKTTDTIKEVLQTIAEKETLSHPKEYYGLFLCNDGIFMREERTLGSYYLVKMVQSVLFHINIHITIDIITVIIVSMKLVVITSLIN